MTWQHFVAMGDSLTEGWGEPYPGLEHLSWAERLARAIAPLHDGFEFTNLSFRGLTLAQVEERQLQEALTLQPDLASLNAGANDVAWNDWNGSTYHARMDRMLAALGENGATLITFTLADVWHILPYAPAGFYDRVREMNDVIRELSAKHDTVFFDFWQHPEVMPPDSWGGDAVHPNALGYLQMARALADALGQRAGIDIAGESLALPASP
jgi:lysophospholipase L1-like esterase